MTLTTTMPLDLKLWIAAEAKRQGMSRSTFVRIQLVRARREAAR